MPAEEESILSEIPQATSDQIEGNIEVSFQTGASGNVKALPTRKIILIKRNVNGNPETEGKSMHTKQGIMDYKASSNKRVMADKGKTEVKRKPKPFRPEWLTMDIFKDWLAPDPTNPSKARCIACDTVLNAGKSELEKHAVGAKHADNLESLKQTMMVQRMLDEVNKDGEGDFDDDDDEDDDDDDDIHITRERMSVSLEQGEKQLEALNRIATSMEHLASETSECFNKLAKSQEIIANILSKLIKN